MALTSQQLNQLVENYAKRIVDDMDLKTLMQFVYETICENLRHMNEEDVLNEIHYVCDDDDVVDMLVSEVLV